MGLDVPECSGYLTVVVDRVTAAAPLALYLPVVEAGDDVFDPGRDAVRPVVVVGMIRPVWSRLGVMVDVVPRYAPSPSTTGPSSSWVTV